MVSRGVANVDVYMSTCGWWAVGVAVAGCGAVQHSKAKLTLLDGAQFLPGINNHINRFYVISQSYNLNSFPAPESHLNKQFYFTLSQ